jgi:hypothetical protein
MSDNDRRFVERALAGEVMIDEIDNFVDDWHDNPRNRPLYEHLGFTKAEYALWLRSPDALPLILSSRKLRTPLAS